jgi:hypothetical protein
MGPHRIAARWFAISLYFFVVSGSIAAAFAVFGPVFQVRMLGLLTLASALAGVAVCVFGLRVFNPLQWSGMIARNRWRRMQVRDFFVRIREPEIASPQPVPVVGVTPPAATRIAPLAAALSRPAVPRAGNGRLSLVRSYG